MGEALGKFNPDDEDEEDDEGAHGLKYRGAEDVAVEVKVDGGTKTSGNRAAEQSRSQETGMPSDE